MSTFRATTPYDSRPLSAFLMRVFGSLAGPSMDNPALMHWKYWEPRGDWTGARSYVLEREGRIVAHAGLWPITFMQASASVRGVQMIDWAADAAAPGAGFSLVQKLAKMLDFMYSIGGSDATKKVLPALGFREAGQVWTAARPLRPLRQTLSHQTVNWKLAPRLLRNSLWSMFPGRPKAAAWKLAPASPDQLPESAESQRGSPFFAYLLRCPAGRPRLFRILQDDTPQGHLVLGVIRGQARVGGVWLKNPDPERWRSAYTLAQIAARQLAGANEIAAAGSMGPSETAAEQAGFRITKREPLYLLNKRGTLTLPPGFQFQMTEDDAFFRDIGRADYFT